MDWISFLKVAHIIGWVSWFAGFFYIGRMFVYHREAADKPAGERAVLQPQYSLMMQRAYKLILNPAMMIAWVCGIAMLVVYTMQTGSEWIKANGWMHTKLLLLVFLVGYHIWVKKTIAKAAAGSLPYNSFKFRMLNELPTLFLVAITALAIYKNSLNYGLWALSLLLLTGLIYFMAKAYQKKREG